MKDIIDVPQYLKEYRIKDAFEVFLAGDLWDNDYLFLFQRILGINWNLYKLQDFAPQMKHRAARGDSWFQYAWARYNDALRPYENSIDIAIENYEKAAEAGVPDAIMCLAYFWKEGEFGLVNLDKYESELDRAIDAGSDMAQLQKLRDAIWGEGNRDKDPRMVYDAVTEVIKNAGDDEDNCLLSPQYFTVAGVACEELGRSLEAYTWYEKALKRGDPKACLNMAILSGGLDDDGYIIRTDDFMEIISKGIGMGIPNCETYRSFIDIDKHLATLSPEEKARYLEETFGHFRNACALGDSDGAFLIGECYHNGLYGIEQEPDKAWEWYMRGAVVNNYACLQRIADMILEGQAPSGFDEDFAYKCELMSLRYGNSDTLMNVVRAYRQGHLQDYAEEIERYYVPEYEERYEFEDPEEEVIVDEPDEEMMSRICP